MSVTTSNVPGVSVEMVTFSGGPLDGLTLPAGVPAPGGEYWTDAEQDNWGLATTGCTYRASWCSDTESWTAHVISPGGAIE